MPIYNFVCSSCEVRARRMLTVEAAKEEVSCKECGALLLRERKADIGAMLVESLDNGAMPRRVERLADAERIYKDHAKSGGK